jgi:HPt (histidine-containing phosphotransfer) domain-containing protein
MGGRDLAMELLERFLQEGPERLDLIRSALEKGDRLTLQQNLHRVCSDAGWLGAKEVQALANEMEVTAQTGSLEGFADHVERLTKLCYETSVLLEQEKARMNDSKEGQAPTRAKAEA